MEDRTMNLDRRQFLGGALMVGGILAMPRLALGQGAARGADGRTLVLLHLVGGNDGLNTVIPWKDPLYRTLRPSLGLDRDQVLKLTDDLGLHPSLTGFEALFRRKRLAIVNGVGYPNPNYSHFRATEIWYTAQPESSPRYGWIGRALDANPSDKPLRGVALQKEPPLTFASEKPGTVTMTDFGRFRVPSGMKGATSLYEQYANLDGVRAEVGVAGTQALEVARRIARLRAAGGPFRGRLGADLRKVMALLKADLDLECIQVPMGGYDTHADESATHRHLFTELGANLDAFQAEVEKAGLGPRVVTLVISEFGRRVPENLSGGTDHGSAGPVFVVGQGLHAGFHGAYPSLEDLDRGNFKFTTDFRRVYASVLASALRVDPKPVLGDFEPLELFA
jgi:uncharacterized protein (DUF1501 family)